MFRGVCFVALAALAACGPITYAGEVHRASDAVDAARAIHADELSPYWWTRATEYLREARERAGHSDFGAANRYGKLATEAANHAEDDARFAAKRPTKRATPAAPPSPAKDAP
jgi:hypothetical protein